MSYSFNGNCYAKLDDAANAVLSSFPRWTDDGIATIHNFNASADGLVSFSSTTAGLVSNQSFSLLSDCVSFGYLSSLSAVLFCFFAGWGCRLILNVFTTLTGAERFD